MWTWIIIIALILITVLALLFIFSLAKSAKDADNAFIESILRQQRNITSGCPVENNKLPLDK